MSIAVPCLRFDIESYPLSSLSADLTKTVQETAKIWAAIARSRSFNEPTGQTSFKDRAIETSVLSDCIKIRNGDSKEFDLILGKDAKGKIAAIAITYVVKQQLRIRFLVTDPELSTTRAGEAIIWHLKDQMDKSKEIDEIGVGSFISGIDFYTKTGFVKKASARRESFDGTTTDGDIFCEMHLPKKPGA